MRPIIRAYRDAQARRRMIPEALNGRVKHCVSGMHDLRRVPKINSNVTGTVTSAMAIGLTPADMCYLPE